MNKCQSLLLKIIINLSSLSFEHSIFQHGIRSTLNGDEIGMSVIENVLCVWNIKLATIFFNYSFLKKFFFVEKKKTFRRQPMWFSEWRLFMNFLQIKGNHSINSWFTSCAIRMVKMVNVSECTVHFSLIAFSKVEVS